MNYDEALEYIHGTHKLGSKLGLQNISALLNIMGSPQKHLKFIHVAGTNGKGSTTAMIASILQEQGYKVGMYTSPYIEDFRERIQINGQYIEKEKLAEIVSRIKIMIQQMVEQGFNHPTEFEIITALAFQYYYEQKCDYVVLEVGLGGRLDATNVIETPLVSVITSISMDHMEYLGNTIQEIAYEKCGIIKKNGTVVVYPKQDHEALEVIKQVSKEKNAKVLIADSSRVSVLSDTLEGLVFDYKPYGNLELPLIGEHQVFNAVTAVTVVEVLKQYCGISITQDSIKKGLKKVCWPGRMEVLSTNPTFIIDGAHNIAGIRALKKSILKYLQGMRIILIMGMLQDKEYRKCIAEIAPIADLMIATMPVSNRALSGERLGELASRYCHNVKVENDYRTAIDTALKRVEKDKAILCCGSLYLVGSVRQYFRSIYSK